jgi:hypothetical protein
MKETDKANGFANRFMFVCVNRSKKLPHGGSIDAEELRQLSGKIINAVDWAKQNYRLMQLDAETHEWWEAAYTVLTDVDRSGAFAKVKTRRTGATVSN